MNDSSAIYLIFSLLKVQIENLSFNKDDRECRKDIKTLERAECKTLFYNCISSTVWFVQKVQLKNIFFEIIAWKASLKALESSWNSIFAILFSNNQTLNHLLNQIHTRDPRTAWSENQSVRLGPRFYKFCWSLVLAFEDILGLGPSRSLISQFFRSWSVDPWFRL